MRKLIWLKLIILTVFAGSCELDKCLQKKGKETTEVFYLDSFRCVDINGVFDVQLIPDSVYYIEAIGGENVLNDIDYDLQGDTLFIYDFNSCMWRKEYSRPHLQVHFPDLNRVVLTESAYLFSTDSIPGPLNLIIKARLSEVDLILNNSRFFVYNHMSSGGRVTLSGKTGVLYVSGYYNTIYDASKLQTKEAWIKNFSVADYKVWVTDKLHAEIHSSGKIFFRGNPEVTIDSLVSTGGVFPFDY